MSPGYITGKEERPVLVSCESHTETAVEKVTLILS